MHRRKSVEKSLKKLGKQWKWVLFLEMDRNYPSCWSSVVLCIKGLLILSKQLGIVN